MLSVVAGDATIFRTGNPRMKTRGETGPNEPQASERLLFTTVVGSYPQPEWLIDRRKLEDSGVPRVRSPEIWRVPEDLLEEAQDDATVIAIRAMERADI